jgi:Pvc16 N-terminal domain
MSNFLAIATVTATLQRMLQAAVQLDVPGARVTMARPDSAGSGVPEVGVNIFLYQAAPNPAWRNADLRNRRPKGELIKQAQAGLDLHYLLTFYGNETELEPQRLLGSTVRTLVDQPILTAEMIRDTVNNPNFDYLQNSTLGDQIERVTIVPSFLSTDELSKIWSIFFQSPYNLSFACQGGAVLIEGEKPSGRGLPIRSRQFYATPTQPFVDRVTSDVGNNQATADSRLTIRGKQLREEVTAEQFQAEQSQYERMQNRLNQNQLETGSSQEPPLERSPRRGVPIVQIGEAKLTPHLITDTEIQLNLSDLPGDERSQLRAGVQSFQIVYPLMSSLADFAREIVPPERLIQSNVVPFVVFPGVIQPIQVNAILRDGNQIVTADITVLTDVLVDTNQRVFLLLNQCRVEKPVSYIFAAHKRNAATSSLRFTTRDIRAGEYLVRVQVDGAESTLDYDGEQYVNPKIDIR